MVTGFLESYKYNGVSFSYSFFSILFCILVLPFYFFSILFIIFLVSYISKIFIHHSKFMVRHIPLHSFIIHYVAAATHHIGIMLSYSFLYIFFLYSRVLVSLHIISLKKITNLFCFLIIILGCMQNLIQILLTLDEPFPVISSVTRWYTIAFKE